MKGPPATSGTTLTPAAAVGQAGSSLRAPTVVAADGRARSSTRATPAAGRSRSRAPSRAPSRAASSTTTDEDMDVDEEDEHPLSKEERRAAKKAKLAREAEQRVAWDGQRAILQSFAEAGNTARFVVILIAVHNSPRGAASILISNISQLLSSLSPPGRPTTISARPRGPLP